jgi:mono/diheme cytochrome c family protein
VLLAGQVVAFLLPDCPLAKLYAKRLTELAARYPQVQFRAVVASEQAADRSVIAMRELLSFAYDRDQALIDRLQPTHSPEVFLLHEGCVAYRGRIDDQYTPGTNRGQPTRNDLELALLEVLADQPVSIAQAPAAGCRLLIDSDVASPAGKSAITYDDVAAIFHAKCAGCHREGQVGPFSLLTYDDVVRHEQPIRDAIFEGRMPPWHANPRIGKFANDRSLSAREKSLLTRWFAAGLPGGTKSPEPPQFSEGWSVRPDVVLEMPAEFDVPAEGIIEYQEFVIPSGFAKDTWIEAVEIRPGNRAVVHHVNVLVRPAGFEPETAFLGPMEDWYFAIMGPGNAVTIWPEGTAKLIPAGWDVVLSIHYQAIGTEQRDRTSLALQIADARSIRKPIATRAMMKHEISLPPNEVTTLTNTWVLEDDYTLHSLVPHMHLRGRSMRIEAGTQVLLDIPRFDFNWQHRYIFAEPLKLRRGTLVTATATYDNTASNPNNPDPSATVVKGRLTSDEMFQLNWDISRTHENRLAGRWKMPVMLLAMLASFCAFVFLRPVGRG